LDPCVPLYFFLVGGMRVLGYDEGSGGREVGRVWERDGLWFCYGGGIVGEGVFGC
jgi:hypothetical protein